jgi:hypothetical protein
VAEGVGFELEKSFNVLHSRQARFADIFCCMRLDSLMDERLTRYKVQPAAEWLDPCDFERIIARE